MVAGFDDYSSDEAPADEVFFAVPIRNGSDLPVFGVGLFRANGWATGEPSSGATLHALAPGETRTVGLLCRRPPTLAFPLPVLLSSSTSASDHGDVTSGVDSRRSERTSG